MKKIKAILFDMDGTLLDSEPIFLKSDLAVVAAYGGFMSEEEHDQYIGMGAKEFIRLIKLQYNITAPSEEIRDFQEITYLQLARAEIQVFPEMVQFARWAKERGIPLAIASGSTTTVIEEMTELTGISSLFDHRVSSEEVERGKPYPDVFLETARRLHVDPENCLVLEDSPFGIEAALRAGMSSIAVPAPIVQDPNGYLEKADICYRGGMLEFTCDDLIKKLEDRVFQPV